MGWEIKLSRQAEKFLARDHLADSSVTERIKDALLKFSGETVAVDVSRLTGQVGRELSHSYRQDTNHFCC